MVCLPKAPNRFSTRSKKPFSSAQIESPSTVSRKFPGSNQRKDCLRTKICPQVIEFGPLNASIHKIDEWVEVASLEPLKNIYRRTLEALLT